MGALRGLVKELGTRVGRLETRVKRIRLQQSAGGLAVSETPTTDVPMTGYSMPRGQHNGEFDMTLNGHVSSSKSDAVENRTPIGSARYKSVAPPSTPSDPRPTLLQIDGRTQFKSARYKSTVESALLSLGLVTVSKPSSKPVRPGGLGNSHPITLCAKSN